MPGHLLLFVGEPLLCHGMDEALVVREEALLYAGEMAGECWRETRPPPWHKAELPGTGQEGWWGVRTFVALRTMPAVYEGSKAGMVADFGK